MAGFCEAGFVHWDILSGSASLQTPASRGQDQYQQHFWFRNDGVRDGAAPLPGVCPKWARQTLRSPVSTMPSPLPSAARPVPD